MKDDRRVRMASSVLVGVAMVAVCLVFPATRAAAAAEPPVGVVTRYLSPSVGSPAGITSGPDGARWFTNPSSNTIGRITKDGAISTFGDATIADPHGIVVGPDGALWFTNHSGNSIGRITTAGVISHFTGAGVTAPTELVAGPDGALWFLNHDPDSIGRISMGGAITTFVDARVVHPVDIAAGPDGALWLTLRDVSPGTTANAVARISTAGAITTFPDWSTSQRGSIATGPDGALWYVNSSHGFGRMTTAGVFTWSSPTYVRDPGGLEAGPDGALWFANHDTYAFGRIAADGTVTTEGPQGLDVRALTFDSDGVLWFATASGDPLGRRTGASTSATFGGTASQISQPTFITTGPDGALWFSNTGNDSIGRITVDGAVSNFKDPSIDAPTDIVLGPDGALWFTNAGGHTIGRITTTGVASSYYTYGVYGPSGIVAGPDGALWFTNQMQGSLGRISTAGTFTLFKQPSIKYPTDLVVGQDGALWFTDLGTNTIGRMTTTGALSLFPIPGATGDHADRIAAAADGTLWFGLGVHSLGHVDGQGKVTVVTDGRLDRPGDLAAGGDGTLWFTNSGANTIGRINGAGELAFLADPTIAKPGGIVAGPDGGMWFGNTGSPGISSIGRVQALGAPAPPTNVVAVAAKGSATVSWSAPFANNGAPITAYTVTSSPGGKSCTWSAGPLTCTLPTLDPGTPYSFTVTATSAKGTSAPSPSSNAVTPWSGSAFHPVTPFRALDSRTATGGWSGPLVNGTPRDLQVIGGGVPATATAVVANVTVTQGTAPSYLTLGPAGVALPTASTLNFAPGQTIPNLAAVKVGADGKVRFANAAGAVHVVVDITGYFDDGNGTGDLFNPTAPARVLDSRTALGSWGGPLVAGVPRVLPVRGVGSVPPTASAVVANVTVTNPTAGSFVRVTPTGSPPGVTSNLNVAAGQTTANLVVSEVGADGSLTFVNAVGATDVVVDVVGYFGPGSGARFHAVVPTRVLDDRLGIGASGPWAGPQTRAVPIAPSGAVPAGAVAVVLNATVTNPTHGSYLTLFANGGARPTASTLNFGPGQTVANLAVPSLDASGQLAVYNHLGSVDVVADVAGYFASI